MKKFNEFLKEAARAEHTVIKDRVGKGTFHVVYPSVNRKDYVIKVSKMGHEFKINDPNSWFNIFKKHPDLFPRIYKVHKNYVMVERLDTEKAEKEIAEMERELEVMLSVDEFFSDSSGVFDITEILQRLCNDQERILKYAKNRELFKKWFDLIKKIDDLHLRNFIDFNDGNFGYAKDGELKMLDI